MFRQGMTYTLMILELGGILLGSVLFIIGRLMADRDLVGCPEPRLIPLQSPNRPKPSGISFKPLERMHGVKRVNAS